MERIYTPQFILLYLLFVHKLTINFVDNAHLKLVKHPIVTQYTSNLNWLP